jgi:circadian clock protein KaiC
MSRQVSASQGSSQKLSKARTGITGFDEITYGGLPRGRPTLVCGAAGSGKTLFGIEFLIRGAVESGENGVLIAFEETPEELAKNVASLGFDLDALVRDGKIAVDFIKIDRHEVEETGEYDLEGLFLRLGLAIDTVKAKRVFIDTIETLFSALKSEFVLRAELRRLFRWLKDRGVTAVITGERGDGSLTRYGLEEYVSDCVVLLDNRVVQQAAVRRLRVIKYRGSRHGTSEYPFLIGESGFSVLPLSSINLDHNASTARQSSGVHELDEMLEGKGYYKGSTILISGTAGTGKSSLAAFFADAVCAAGKRCLYFAFEEGVKQIQRNMLSIGLNLEKWVAQKKLMFHAGRPTEQGLETHLAMIGKLIKEHQPDAVILDPITNFEMVGDNFEVKAMLMRLVDLLKQAQVTCLFTSLTSGAARSLESTDTAISSLVDTWLQLRDIESNGERNRGLYVLKSRGMAHSNQIREFIITSAGIRMFEAYVGAGGNLLTGSARLQQEVREREGAASQSQDERRMLAGLERRRRVVERQIEALKAELVDEELEARLVLGEVDLRKKNVETDRESMALSRRVGTNGSGRRSVR